MRPEKPYVLGLFLILAGASWGCASTTIQPGHRGLLFDPKNGGLGHEVLSPGYYRLRPSAHIADYDITYSTRTESIKAHTSEGLGVEVKLGVIYRPVVSELYELDTEIGPNYYDEVVGPELRSAALGIVARHSCADLVRNDQRQLVDEIEAETRMRLKGRHVELAAAMLESLDLPPELVAAVRARVVAAQNALRDEADRARAKVVAQENWEKEKLELEHDVERRRLQREAEGPAK
jgi:prohibitin 2